MAVRMQDTVGHNVEESAFISAVSELAVAYATGAVTAPANLGWYENIVAEVERQAVVWTRDGSKLRNAVLFQAVAQFTLAYCNNRKPVTA